MPPISTPDPHLSPVYRNEVTLQFTSVQEAAEENMNIEFIQLAHGSGGSGTAKLIQQIFLPHFHELGLQPENDAALLSLGSKTLAFTIDGFVVEPPFFPGGDLGSLAINGTINDLAVMGAKPLWLACGFIISVGVAGTVLDRIAASIRPP